MRAHESYKDIAHQEFYNNNQPVFVSPYIEHIMLIPDAVCRSEVFPYIRKRCPLGRLYRLIPPLQCYLRVFPAWRLIKLPELPV